MNPPQIATSGDVPTVRTHMLKGTPYVQILDEREEPLLDLTCTDALNLALLLVHQAGQELSARLARTLPVVRRARGALDATAES